jgi:hypothetical protein
MSRGMSECLSVLILGLLVIVYVIHFSLKIYEKRPSF